MGRQICISEKRHEELIEAISVLQVLRDAYEETKDDPEEFVFNAEIIFRIYDRNIERIKVKHEHLSENE